MSTEPTVPVVLLVGGRKLAAGATRDGQWWTLTAGAFPTIGMVGRDFRQLKVDLARRLLPHCVAWEQRVREQKARKS